MEKTLEPSFNNLPKDIIFDIFSRIPLQILYQIRCVCKKWQFLLDLDQEFRGFYHQQYKTSPILVLTQENTENSSTLLSPYFIDGTKLHNFFTNYHKPLTSILSCNGILCLIQSNSNVILCDPIIKRVSNLPKTPHFSSTFSWSFGFSGFGNCFKLLHFYIVEKFDNFHYCKVKEVMCEIITYPNSHIGLNSQKDWRFLGKCSFNILGRKDYAYVNGNIYWLIVEKKFDPNCVKIMSFDMENEQFGMVCFPRSYSNRSVECLDLIEIKDELCLSDRLPWESTMNVWMMMNNEDGFGDFWVKKYEIDLMGIVHHDVRILDHLSKNNSLYESEGEILIKVGEQRYGFYELESGVFKDLGDKINMEGWNLQLVIDRKLLL